MPGVGNEGLLQINIRGKIAMRMKRPEECKEDID
jgi:hypothetical protein